MTDEMTMVPASPPLRLCVCHPMLRMAGVIPIILRAGVIVPVDATDRNCLHVDVRGKVAAVGVAPRHEQMDPLVLSIGWLLGVQFPHLYKMGKPGSMYLRYGCLPCGPEVNAKDNARLQDETDDWRDWSRGKMVADVKDPRMPGIPER